MNRSFRLQPLDQTRQDTGPLVVDTLPCVIGRSRGCELRLNLDRISRRHLQLNENDGRLLVEDLGSTNGTFVNEQRISAPTPLEPGDTVHIADYAFRLDRVETDDRGAPHRAGRPDTLAGQTIAGFTGDPTGFPVQAPQFYELLNEALIEPEASAATAEGDERVLLVGVRSTHPALQADYPKLAEIARQLGEEARFHRQLRARAGEVSDDCQLDDPLLALPVDPLELEDADLLLEELQALRDRHRHLRLGCRINPAGLDPDNLPLLAEALTKIGIVLVLEGEPSEGRLDDGLIDLGVISAGSSHEAFRPIREFA